MISVSIRRPLALACAAMLLLSACGNDDTTPSVPAVMDDVALNYANIVHASYVDSQSTAAALETSIAALTATPSEAALADARAAWRASREPYLQTEVYRFYDGPIDNPDDGPEGLLNAWPLDEAHIDYVVDAPEAGIVNDTSITLDADALQSLNEQGGEKNVATGYHAIEFLLWGQDFQADGPGDRPHTDYITGEGGGANAERRAQYIEIASALMVQHLGQLVSAWTPDSADNYRATFLASSRDEQLRRILTGMIVLSGFETGGERLQTALDSGDQEDEHSCFSDNTHRDMVQDIQGVLNVFEGRYTRTDGSVIEGPGIYDVIAARDSALADAIDTRIRESLSLAQALQPPFDQEIALTNPEGRARVQALITSLRQQEGLLQDAFLLFDLDVPVVE